jgi:hypothetical protein
MLDRAFAFILPNWSSYTSFPMQLAVSSPTRTLFPDQLPDQAGTHDDVPIMVDRSFDRRNPHAVLLTPSRVRGLSGPWPSAYSWRPVHHRSTNPQRTSEPSDWWLLLAANLEPLPPSCCPSFAHLDPAASVSLARLPSLDRSVRELHDAAPGGPHATFSRLVSLSAS